MDYLYIIVGVCSFIAGALLLVPLSKLIAHYRVLCAHNIPAIGGIASGVAFLAVSFIGLRLVGQSSVETVGILTASSAMLVFGILDDLCELGVGAKFFVQIVAASFLIFFNVRTEIVYLSPWANILITIVWVVGITNAFNHLDVMDGVAAGIAIIVAAAFYLVAFINGDVKTALMAVALVGTSASFLINNLPPARIYMGNAGSHFIGFVFAALALKISYASLERSIALITPLLILGFPIFDTAFLILMRVRQGKSAFLKSDDHFALRLLKKGYSKPRALIAMLWLAAFYSVCGVVLSQASNKFGVVILAVVAAVSLGLVREIGKGALDG